MNSHIHLLISDFIYYLGLMMSVLLSEVAWKIRSLSIECSHRKYKIIVVDW